MEEETGAQRPTVWIVTAGVLAVVAIGFAIWGFGQKSDADDAQKTVDAQQQQLDAQGQKAAKVEASDTAYGHKAEKAYERTRAQLVGADRTEAQIKADVKKQSAQLKAARAQVAAANGATAKAKAQANAARQETDVAAACAKGTVNAIDDFFNSANPNKGAQKALKKLQSLQSQCRSVLNE